MMELVWNTFFFEQKIAKMMQEYEQYDMESIENIFSDIKGFVMTDIISEKELLKELCDRFCLIYDVVNTKEKKGSNNVVLIAYEIINKIMYYYLSKDLTGKLLESWGHIQSIIFPYDEQYRDHLIHQFYVFLIGATILSKLDVRILENWRIIEKVERDEDEMRRRTFRSWVSASMFHDIGYIVKKLLEIEKSIHKNYFLNLPGVEWSNFKLQINDRDDIFKDYLNRIDRVYIENEFAYTRREATGEGALRIKNEICELNHGVLSSYIIWNICRHTIKGIDPRYINTIKAHLKARASIIHEQISVGNVSRSISIKTHLISSEEIIIAKADDDMLNELYKQEIEEDIDIAAFAIAMHDIEEGYVINFFTHPLTFLLLLCDELQDWGRVRVQNNEVHMKSNEFLRCKVFLKNEYHQMATYISDFKRIEDYCCLISKDNTVTDAARHLVNCLSSDVIVMSYVNISKNDIQNLCSKLKKMFEKRLKNGPSIIVTNRKIGDTADEIAFIAKIGNNKEYNVYIL